jgi:hypothetical protein
MAKRRFHPWVGADYRSSTTRLLVVGESHYGHEGEDEPGFTNTVIDKWRSGKEKLRYYTKLARLVTGKPIAELDRASDLNGIAFTNYVQELLAWNNKERPDGPTLNEAQAPFLETVQELDPTHILVTGHRAYEHMPKALNERYDCVSGARLWVCEYATPSGQARTMAVPHLSRTSVARWIPVLQEVRSRPPIMSRR